MEAMVRAAAALLKTEMTDVPAEDDRVVAEFRTRFYDSRKFFDPYAGGKFAQYLFAARARNGGGYTLESAHHLIEEAQLFIEAAHNCYNRMSVQPAGQGAAGSAG